MGQSGFLPFTEFTIHAAADYKSGANLLNIIICCGKQIKCNSCKNYAIG
jgi:hypothetical protein